MAYITPNTNLRILKGIPWTSDYASTMWFTSEAEQRGYMEAHEKYIESGYTYQRVSDGVVRVGRLADDLYDCNYIMFQNDSFGSKWFYAFITGVDYVNNGCSNVHFEIDSVQTWFFEAFGEDGKSNIKPCYVLRQHAETDEPGDNIEPEPVELGEYRYTPETEAMVYTATGTEYSPSDLGIIIALCDVKDESYTNANMYSGIFSGSTLRCYSTTELSYMENLIQSYIEDDKSDAILQIYMCPRFLYIDHQSQSFINNDASVRSINTLDLSSIARDTNDKFGGYTPKNKKLYTYPYYFGYLIGNNGNNIIFRYEYTKDGTPEAFISGSYLYPPEYAIRPYNYGQNDDSYLTQRNYEQSIVISDFPQCSWNADSYSQWQAQVSTKQTKFNEGMGAFITTLGAALTAIPITSGVGVAVMGMGASMTVGEAVSEMRGQIQASHTADISYGNLSSGSVDSQSGLNTIFKGKGYVDEGTARYIDDYFTLYGYAQNHIMTPNPMARKYWTYIHTDGYEVCRNDRTFNENGAVPDGDKQVIKNMFNKGFTAWNHANVSSDIYYGDYSLNNEII